MDSFASIYARAAERKGGEAVLKSLLPVVPGRDAVAALDEARFLAEMARCIFQAGFVWRVIEQKWPGFETVFHGFDVGKLLSLVPDELDELAQDQRIVRNRQKIDAVLANARFIEDVAIEQGSFADFIAGWPEHDLVGLFELLKTRGSRLGGMSGQRFLRNVGKDSFVLTGDVVRAVRESGVEIAANPTSKRDLRTIQVLFNRWHEESGLPYTHLSKIAAFSVGRNLEPELLLAQSR